MSGDSETQTDDFAIFPSVGFAAWLAGTGGSFVFSSYQSGKVLAVGRNADGTLRANERTFRRAMGIAVSPDRQRLFLATRHEIFRLDNFLPPGELWQDGSDALYVPRRTWITGQLDAHDICLGEDQTPVFVNTAFNCLATVADGFSFDFLWSPAFISDLAAEDRCHLNGLAMADGKPRYVTAVSATDTADSWRGHRLDGGVVIDVARGKTVCAGLSMPHSPRIHDGRLWLLNSGRGEFGWVDTDSGVFHPLALCAGYARGLAFVDRFAIIGLSLPRHEQSFLGLPLDEVLAAHGLAPRCGVMVVDIITGETVGGLKIEGKLREIYDVQFLPGLTRPSLIGFSSAELQNLISVAPSTDPRATVVLARRSG